MVFGRFCLNGGSYANAKVHNKLMDESRSLLRTMDDKLNTTLHDSRVKFDRERSRADHLIYLVQQHRHPDDVFDRIQESVSNLKRMKVRQSDFLQHFQEARQAAIQNEVILKRRLGQIRYLVLIRTRVL